MKQFFDEYFDMVYFINLPHRKDRYENVMYMFKKLNITKYTYVEGIQSERGHLGCRLSHEHIYQDAINKKFKTICIFEDDFTFNVDFPQIEANMEYHLENCFQFLRENKDWDLFYFDNIYSADRSLDDKQLLRMRRLPSTKEMIPQFGGKKHTQSYALRLGKGLNNFLYELKKNKEPIDKMLMITKSLNKFYYSYGLFDQLVNNDSDTVWKARK